MDIVELPLALLRYEVAPRSHDVDGRDTDTHQQLAPLFSEQEAGLGSRDLRLQEGP